jgi:hypothetical protein
MCRWALFAAVRRSTSSITDGSGSGSLRMFELRALLLWTRCTQDSIQRSTIFRDRISAFRTASMSPYEASIAETRAAASGTLAARASCSSSEAARWEDQQQIRRQRIHQSAVANASAAIAGTDAA